MTDSTFGGIKFGDPTKRTFDIDWEGIEKSTSDFEKAVAEANAKNSNKRVGSGFTSYQPMDKLTRLTVAGSGIGFATGVAYAFHKQTGFWKGWGLAIVGAVTVASLTRGVGFLTTKN